MKTDFRAELNFQHRPHTRFSIHMRSGTKLGTPGRSYSTYRGQIQLFFWPHVCHQNLCFLSPKSFLNARGTRQRSPRRPQRPRVPTWTFRNRWGRWRSAQTVSSVENQFLAGWATPCCIWRTQPPGGGSRLPLYSFTRLTRHL